MARKNPIGKIKDAALETLKDPVGSAGKAVGQARETVELGRLVAGQVTKSAAGTAVKGAGVVTSLVPGRKPPTPPRPASPTAAPDLEPAVPADGSRKVHGDPLEPAATAAVARTPAAPSKKAPAKKAPATKAPATMAPAKKAPATKAAAKKSPTKKASAPTPVNVTRELGLDEAPVEKNPLPAPKAATKKTAAKKSPAKKATKKSAKPATSIDAAASRVEVDVTPGEVAEKVAKKASTAPSAATATKATPPPAKKSAAKKAPAKRTATKKSAPGAKLPPRRATAPLSAAELAGGAGTEVITPVGTRGADVATNPDTTETDLQQVGTEPLVDPATTKAVASEQAQLSAAADPDKA